MGSEFLWCSGSSCWNSVEPFLETETTALQDRHFSDQDENIAAALPFPLHPIS